MRTFVLFATLLLPCALPYPLLYTLQAQTSSPHSQTDLNRALAGNWTGVLEYRDYSEPATSTKRVQLPTWLSITPSATSGSQTWHYIYDDGPTKVVEETDTITFDLPASTYTESDNNKPPRLYKVSGLDTLRNGTGQLILTGPGTDNNQPAETRITLTLRRNLLDILEETRPAASSEPFAFRHAFRFTRSTPPPLLPPTK